MDTPKCVLTNNNYVASQLELIFQFDVICYGQRITNLPVFTETELNQINALVQSHKLKSTRRRPFLAELTG